MAQRTCSIDGCDRKHYARTWCSMHYKRWAAQGDPEKSLVGYVQEYFYDHLMTVVDGCKIWPYSTSAGYGQVNQRDGTWAHVHVLACEAWHGPRPEGMMAAHGPCHDPACWNGAHLSWKTPQQNSSDRYRDGTMLLGDRHPMAKLSASVIPTIRNRIADGEPLAAIGSDYGVTGQCIDLIRKGKTWRHVPS